MSFSFFFFFLTSSGETLLQQKLQESNSRLYNDVSQTLRQVYSGATKEVGDVSDTARIKKGYL